MARWDFYDAKARVGPDPVSGPDEGTLSTRKEAAGTSWTGVGKNVRPDFGLRSAFSCYPGRGYVQP